MLGTDLHGWYVRNNDGFEAKSERASQHVKWQSIVTRASMVVTRHFVNARDVMLKVGSRKCFEKIARV
jgi:hypothetical protein